MNCDSWFVPKKVLITDETVRALTRSWGVNLSASRRFIRSLIVRAMRARPSENWLWSCSPTVRTRRLPRWSMSSTFDLPFWSLTSSVMIATMSSFESVTDVSSPDRPSRLFMRYRPTAPRS